MEMRAISAHVVFAVRSLCMGLAAWGRGVGVVTFGGRGVASNRLFAGVGVLECGPEGRGCGSAEPEWLPLGRGRPAWGSDWERGLRQPARRWG